VEVEQHGLGVGGEQDVGGLQVEVDQAVLVGVVQSIGQGTAERLLPRLRSAGISGWTAVNSGDGFWRAFDNTAGKGELLAAATTGKAGLEGASGACKSKPVRTRRSSRASACRGRLPVRWRWRKSGRRMGMDPFARESAEVAGQRLAQQKTFRIRRGC
jgi:hypothetical protein